MKSIISTTLLRVLCAILAVVMSLALVSCAGTNNDVKSGEPGESTDSSTTQSGEPGESADQTNAQSSGAKTFQPGRVNPVGFENDKKSSKDTLIMRIDQDSSHLDTLTGGTYRQNMLIYQLTGSSLFSEGITDDGGVGFIITKYSLTKDYKWDDDYKGITLYIRENAVFHDGSKLTASDIIFSIKRYSENSRYQYINFDGIKAIDEHTVYLSLHEPNSDLFGFLGRILNIFSEKLYKEAEANGTLQDFFYVCKGVSGMYEITEWVPGDHITMVADENYFGGAPKIKNLIIRFIADPTIAMMELETGGVDLLWEPAWNDVKKVLNGEYGDDINGFEDIGDMMMNMGFNMAGPLQDINLRYAICHAIDWKYVTEGSFEGLAQPAYTFQPATFTHLIDIKDWWDSMYDLDLAKDYLAKTKYANGGLTLTMIHNNSPQNKVMLSEMIAKQLEELGITLKIEAYDTATYDAMMQLPEGWDLWLRDWGGSGSIGFTFTKDGWTVTHTNSKLTDPEAVTEMTSIGAELRRTVEVNKSRELSEEIQRGYLDGKWFYFFPVVQQKNFILFNSSLKNFSKTSNYFYITDAYFE